MGSTSTGLHGRGSAQRTSEALSRNSRVRGARVARRVSPEGHLRPQPDGDQFGCYSPRWSESMTEDFDVVVIGGGPDGISGATTAGIFGKRVALVEKLREVGGAGINTGTIPSKTLRETALALSGVRSRKLFGVDLSLRREATVVDFMHHKATVAAHERRRREEQIRTYNVETFHGAANFVDPNTIHVAPDTLLRGERILIATGASPVRPPEFPFEHPRVHDSDEILEIGLLPKTLAVMGAGVIGAEYAGTFNAHGVDVDLIDGRDSLLG